MMQCMRKWMRVTAMSLVAVAAVSCAKKTDPVVRPAPPPAAASGNEMGTTAPPPAPPEPVRDEPLTVAPAADPSIGTKDLDALNRESPLDPVYFALDSYELSAEARTQLTGAAQVLKQNGTWQVTVEGHCDERGTAEYNLSLGERRALAAKAYLVSLGVAADRLRTVSYGREFPFDPGHDEAAWARNRRAHFVITAK